eukprot:gene3275-3552_t
MQIKTHEDLDSAFSMGGDMLNSFKATHGNDAFPATGQAKYCLDLAKVSYTKSTTKEEAYTMATEAYSAGIL